MSDLEQLITFGFDEKKAKRALRKTKNSGLQPALDYLADHEDSNGEESEGEMDIAPAVGPDGAVGEAKSLRCMDCGKVFRSTAEASWHGDKSGHANFEESTEEKAALTEEEKKQKLAELREKAAARKAASAVKDAEEAKRNEAIKRKGGKELQQIKEDLKLKEAQKMVEQKKKEKLEDAKARQKIKAQIEADKKERAEKTALEKALRDGTALPASASKPTGPPPPSMTSNAGNSSANRKETRLQIRLPVGNPLTTTKPSDDTLQSVLDWIRENAPVTVEGRISIPFPRKQFTPEEMQKTLTELGLVPSSVLIVN